MSIFKKKQSDISEANLEIIASMDQSIFQEAYPIAENILDLNLDELIKSDIIEIIPVLRAINIAYKGILGIRDRFFVRKVVLFISQFNSGLDTQEIREFVSDVLTDEKFREQVNEKILILLDRFDDEFKALILAELFKNWIKRNIDWDTFKRLSYSVDRAHSSVFFVLYDAYVNVDSVNLKTDSEAVPINSKAYVSRFHLILASGLAEIHSGSLSAVHISKDAIDICKYGLKNLLDSQYQILTRDIIDSLKKKTKNGERLLDDPSFSEYERMIIEQGSSDDVSDFRIRARYLEKIRAHYSI
nr:hypothetical protein [uncultured Methanoregula sp.]